MAESEQPAPTLVSIQILLPESIERRFERRSQRIRGASWPTWGGHITLVPLFRARVTKEEIRAVLNSVCAQEKPFSLRLTMPIAVQDFTRQDYRTVFLTVEDQSRDSSQRLHELRNHIMIALEPLREDRYPELVGRPF